MSTISAKNLIRAAYIMVSTTLTGCASPNDALPAQIAIYQEIYSGQERALVVDAVNGGATTARDGNVELVEIDYVSQQEIRALRSGMILDLNRVKGVVRISPFSLPIKSSYFDLQVVGFQDPFSYDSFTSFIDIPTPGYLLGLQGNEGAPHIKMIDTLSKDVTCSSVMWDVKVGERVIRKGVLEISLLDMTSFKDVPWPQIGMVADEKKLTEARSSVARCFATFEKELLEDVAQPSSS